MEGTNIAEMKQHCGETLIGTGRRQMPIGSNQEGPRLFSLLHPCSLPRFPTCWESHSLVLDGQVSGNLSILGMECSKFAP